MILVDSSIWIEVFRKQGSREVKQQIYKLIEEDVALTCPLIKLEVLGGARKEERWEIQGLFRDLKSVVITETVWSQAIELSYKLKDKGFNLPWSDIVIGTAALVNQLQVFAIDKHFNNIASISRLKLYIPNKSN